MAACHTVDVLADASGYDLSAALAWIELAICHIVAVLADVLADASGYDLSAALAWFDLAICHNVDSLANASGYDLPATLALDRDGCMPQR